MTPVTGGIANGQKDGFVLVTGTAEGFFSPRVPVYGVVGMLQQVGRVFVGKSIGHGVSVTRIVVGQNGLCVISMMNSLIVIEIDGTSCMLWRNESSLLGNHTSKTKKWKGN
jgi:hypothetical protein